MRDTIDGKWSYVVAWHVCSRSEMYQEVWLCAGISELSQGIRRSGLVLGTWNTQLGIWDAACCGHALLSMFIVRVQVSNKTMLIYASGGWADESHCDYSFHTGVRQLFNIALKRLALITEILQFDISRKI